MSTNVQRRDPEWLVLVVGLVMLVLLVPVMVWAYALGAWACFLLAAGMGVMAWLMRGGREVLVLRAILAGFAVLAVIGGVVDVVSSVEQSHTYVFND